MKLTKKDVVHIAKLANLDISDKQIKLFQKQISDVLNYMEKLNEVDTSGVEPTSQVTGLRNVFREDKVEPSLAQDEALSNAKNTEDGYFVTEAVF